MTRAYPLDAGDPRVYYRLLRRLFACGVPEQFVGQLVASERIDPPSADHAQPLVSVIMPTHDRAALIGTAIASVLEQRYANWELLVCDDASSDGTAEVVGAIDDPRIRVLALPRCGAAAARNAGLEQARGAYVAYLDTDNLWHPHFLACMVRVLESDPGSHLAYSKYLDIIHQDGGLVLKKSRGLKYDYERLSGRNFIDLNTIVHRRALYDLFGGFNTRLERQQDWDLTLRYCHPREPLYRDRFLLLYQRNADWNQITEQFRSRSGGRVLIGNDVHRRHRVGPAVNLSGRRQLVTVATWDICRNHFSKAYNVAEALSRQHQVQLVGFSFFDEPIFPPYANAQPTFETRYFPGGSFPDWSRWLARAVAAVRGDTIYAVKPRLPSLGLALLGNSATGAPVVVEMNDLESVVTSPQAGGVAQSLEFDEVDPADPGLRDPYGQLWTALMEGLVPRVPTRVTHNANLNGHFGGGAHFVRNLKDEAVYDPARYDREVVRARLGLAPEDRVVLFGGMVRKHKGVFEILELLHDMDPSYKLLVVGSRETPDQAALRKRGGDRLRILEPMDRNEMAAVNAACDVTVLWLDPAIPASRYQMPYKLTDAMAMRLPVVASDAGDLTRLAELGCLRQVPYHDLRGLKAQIDRLFARPEEREEMVTRARRLFQREFSYAGAGAALDLVLESVRGQTGTLEVAEEFAAFFGRFQRSCREATDRPVAVGAGSGP